MWGSSGGDRSQSRQNSELLLVEDQKRAEARKSGIKARTRERSTGVTFLLVSMAKSPTAQQAVSTTTTVERLSRVTQPSANTTHTTSATPSAPPSEPFFFAGQRVRNLPASIPNGALSKNEVLHKAYEHTDGGQRERPVETTCTLHQTSQNGADEGADVNPIAIDEETGVLAHIILTVEIPQYRQGGDAVCLRRKQ